MSINKTCSVPGERSPSHANAAFFWPCLGGHAQLTLPPLSERTTISEGQEETRTWSCKSIKQAMAGDMEDMRNKLPIQNQSAQPLMASSQGVRSLCPAQRFITIRGHLSFHLFILVSRFIRPYFQPRSSQWLANPTGI